MKLPELKTRLKNKYVVRIVAGVLTIALLGSSMTAVAVQADQKKDATVQTEQKEDSSDKKDDIDDLLHVSVSDKEIGKDENVYLISDATGSVYDTIVTDHLINKNQSATLEDQSNRKNCSDHINDSAFPHNKNNSKRNTQNRRKQIIRLCPLQKLSHEMTPPFEISFATL